MLDKRFVEIELKWKYKFISIAVDTYGEYNYSIPKTVKANKLKQKKRKNFSVAIETNCEYSPIIVERQ